ncbi:NFAT activation molecule 1 isoform X2 [Dasypus novemcinctus]|uniref:NFAT activation molecule 1 isoform X2 n=1 Tax=Dasypus novemcinctus TaxID=9361 RepID=UPI00062A794F|nr:NFAT activation molecule 1 isoform X2 [Dasypus novemcinctus]
MESGHQGSLPRPARLLGLLLLPWTLQPGGGQTVTHIGTPIMVSLAKNPVSFSCRITYKYIPEFQKFSVAYFHVNLQGQRSAEQHVDFQPGPGTANQTHTVDCRVTPPLPDESATGTYYCSVRWPRLTATGDGTFILVRDVGYREPPLAPTKQLLFGFTGLLAGLSVLGTALLIWKKKGMRSPGKPPARESLDPRAASHPKQPPAESVYTKELPRFTDESEFNQVYENL